MSKFMAAVRRLFSRRKDNGKADGESQKEPHVPNKYQIAVKAPRQYEEVTLGNDETAPQIQTDVQANTSQNNDCQSAPPRAPRQYEKVDIADGGTVAISS